HQGGIVIAHMARNHVRVALHDAGRNPDVLRVCAVVKQQILTEIFQAAPAEKALIAGSGIGSHHALSDGKLLDIVADRDHIARQFVPEHGGRHDHASMISTAKDLHIGATGQRHFYLYEDVTAVDFRNGYRLHLQVFLAVKHGGHHV